MRQQRAHGLRDEGGRQYAEDEQLHGGLPEGEPEAEEVASGRTAAREGGTRKAAAGRTAAGKTAAGRG
ncbi:hypothetical protein GCM10022384_39270 [Streptomyces marokkonensis]|uniref:Uncharacterized protein n=1 Tax=Streptomyces marokkonensis TaxID=324855 RepID=A0ABP7QTP8_9ACTN